MLMIWVQSSGRPTPDLTRRHQPSSTTTADAMPASWDNERWTEVTPRALARASTVPRICHHRAAGGPETTSASCQCMSPGAPSALAIASFAANRAANEAVAE